jgi:hypothetical protein
MATVYQEFPPDDRLSAVIECFWTLHVEADTTKRVLPDGCADIIFSFEHRTMMRADVVGVMTKAHDVPLVAGQSLLGVRFHPGMATVFLPGPLNRLNDRVLPAQQFLGELSDPLFKRVQSTINHLRRIDAIQETLVARSRLKETPEQWREQLRHFGATLPPISEFTDDVGERQLRRLCVEHSGLSPKQLVTTLRFRQAAERIQHGERDMAKLAVECGFYDQPHMTRHFRRFAGVTPAAYARQFTAEAPASA